MCIRCIAHALLIEIELAIIASQTDQFSRIRHHNNDAPATKIYKQTLTLIYSLRSMTTDSEQIPHGTNGQRPFFAHPQAHSQTENLKGK